MPVLPTIWASCASYDWTAASRRGFGRCDTRNSSRAPGARAVSLSRFLGRPVTAAAALAAMARDSQAGTPLAQGRRLANGELERHVEAALARWKSDKLKRARVSST